jgi:hypothetical protein
LELCDKWPGIEEKFPTTPLELMIMECKAVWHIHTLYMQPSDITWFWVNTRPKKKKNLLPPLSHEQIYVGFSSSKFNYRKKKRYNYKTICSELWNPFSTQRFCVRFDRKRGILQLMLLLLLLLLLMLFGFVLSFWNMISIRNRNEKSWSSLLLSIKKKQKLNV